MVDQAALVARRVSFHGASLDDRRHLLRREWLLTNGLGGYASGTIAGHVSRRYHGLLIAALPAPLGRTVMLNHLEEHVHLPNGQSVQIGGAEPSPHDQEKSGDEYLVEFRLEEQNHVWRYEVGDLILEKRLLFVYGQNTVHISFRLLSHQEGAWINLRPSIHFRGHEHDVGGPVEGEYRLSIHQRRFEITTTEFFPPLRLTVHAERSQFVHEGGELREIIYQMEAERGYRSRGTLWSPGYFSSELRPGREATLVVSTEDWPRILAIDPETARQSDSERRKKLLTLAHPKAKTGVAAELVLAADQFIITPAGRIDDSARAAAAGDEVRTVIAGYHWFTDWGRDTMISLEGLTLATGRHLEAGWILRTFAHYIRDGLIPNLFPEGENEGLYHTADATLWFFHAVDRYVETTNDRNTLQVILPKLIEIVEAHSRGTRFGIGVDPVDGLLRQGAEGYQLTWMDAKVDGWVVTPRRGKAVEINALWYNALCLLEEWLRQEQGEEAAAPCREKAAKARESFNRRFWIADKKHLYDVIDGENGDDAACRPNQVLSISLKHSILDQAHWNDVMETVRQRLLTPVGLRSLSREHPDYKSRYFGDLRARDAAYHQGTVWGWLIGPYIDAWMKLHPEDSGSARTLLNGLTNHLNEACVGSISEIFDAEEPFTPRGCIAQAWSVAEALRCWVKTQ